MNVIAISHLSKKFDLNRHGENGDKMFRHCENASQSL
jgi:hypothetical protein